MTSAGAERSPAPDRLPGILIIKLGAFGNIVLSMAAFAAIRKHHADARIGVLTSTPFADWLRTFPYFDYVMVDPRPSHVDIAGTKRLRTLLLSEPIGRVYDLQTSARSSRYLSVFPPKRRPEWSGIAYGCSLPDRDPNRNHLHDVVRIQGQLRQAGITDFPPADLSWCRGDIDRFSLTREYALLVPGSSAHRPRKRWPVERYKALASDLHSNGIAPVVLGSKQEAFLAEQIPNAIDLTGKTSFGDLADLARGARFAVGNDTGPMHLLATAGCPSVTLFSSDSNPALCAPAGRWTRVLQRDDLSDLPVDAVLNILAEVPD
ncbi:MAG TPA: glycosyltransferase family 9 protein [Rhodopila sp.]|nr:glycosyltransferase family 9 protein [Rhodopila sp.]